MLLLVISSQPKRSKYQKADTGADRTGVVRPRSAQEAWIAVVTRWDDRDRRVRLERRPTTTAVIENEFEHTVSVGNAECGSIQARLSLYGEECGADVRVEHRELELQVIQSGVR